jgi:hypothetical protein
VKIFKAPYVEPLYPLGYAKMKPGFDLGGTRIMMASTAQVYPGITSWNSAVTLANEAAQHVLQRIKTEEKPVRRAVLQDNPKVSTAEPCATC